VARTAAPHPSRGGSRGYSVAYRQSILALHRSGHQVDVSSSTLYRWSRNGVQPKAMTGNKAHRKIAGDNQFLLIMYRLIYPEASLDEVRRFIYENSSNPIIFSRSDISLHETFLDVTTKVASTTAMQALLPHNVRRRNRFWNLPPPHGIRGVPRNDLIDIDECAIFLTRVNRGSSSSSSSIIVAVLKWHQTLQREEGN
jgi:hypothetical protein